MDSLTERQYALEELMPLIREALAAGRTVTFLPRGTSMLPMLRQGRDSVTLSPLPEKLCKYDLVLYQRKNGQYVLHRIIKAGETYTCMGDNQFVKEPGLEYGQMIAVVTAFTRDGKSCSVNSLGHRLYCRFWHFSRTVRHLWRGGWGWLRRHLK